MTTPTPIAKPGRGSVTFVLQLYTVCELNAHEHYRVRARRAKAQHNIVAIHASRAGFKDKGSMSHLFPCRVKFTRVSPGNGLDEGDNLPSAFKHVKDAIARLVGTNDRDPRYVWEYAQRRGKRGEWAVEVTIEPLAGGETC